MADLSRRIIDEIRQSGPMTVARFMEITLTDPTGGYYTNNNPIGAAGDFITAPEVSQIFGEMIGLWCVDQWEKMGRPDIFRLVELGPGRGTLMADVLRAAALRPQFGQAARLHLVEASAPLKTLQKKALAAGNVAWWDDFSALLAGTQNDGPILLIANEFLDALPIEQFVHRQGKWFERLVDVDEDTGKAGGSLRFTLSAESVPAPREADTGAPPGKTAIFEQRPTATQLVAQLAGEIVRTGGGALFIDYGHQGPAFGDTLQAVRNHKKVPVLDTPGLSDLTAHVDFTPLAKAARKKGVAVFGPATQGNFLRALGAEVRSQALVATAPDKQAQILESGLKRLIAEDEMGTLFKVLAITHPDMAAPEGFSS